MRKYLIIGGLIIGIILISLLIIPKENNDEIRIGYKEHIGYLPLFVAYDEGYFEDENLNVKPIKFESTDLMIKSLIKGDLDVLIGVNTLTIFAVEQTSPNKLKIFTGQTYTTQEYADEILVSKDSNIRSISDLKNKKIGLMPGSGMRNFMEVILKNNNIQSNEVVMIEMEPKILLQALASNDIDAVLTLEPLGTMAIEKNIGKPLEEAPFAKYIINPFPIAAGVLSSDFTKRNPEKTEKMVIATNRAIDFIRENPQEAKKIASVWTNTDLNTTLKLKLNKFEKLEEIDKNQMQKVADLYTQLNLLDNNLNISNMFVGR